MPYSILRKALFSLDAETAHDVALNSLKLSMRTPASAILRANVPSHPVTVWGKTFENPVGLAAGLDKHADYTDALDALGFGFVEVGTVTPKPQDGNPKPRLFRLPEHEAIINRFGFNSKGIEHLIEQIKKRKRTGILGINIGKNKATPNEQAVDDYLIGLQAAYDYADYITVNISSPNTPNLRALQQVDALKNLVTPLKEKQKALADSSGEYVPIAVKIAPDLDEQNIKVMAEAFTDTEIDGLICTNTTLDRTAVAGHQHADEAGGLSGSILMEQSTAVLKQFRQAVGNEMSIIGVGGINCGEDAAKKIAAGANLVQIYSGFIYHGPALIKDCVHAIKAAAH